MSSALNPAAFTDAERRRGILVIYANTLLMWGGFFMVIPLIATHYVTNLGWSTVLIGAVLATRQIVQQGLSLIGGVMADRLGARLPIVAGLLVRAVGFSWMAFADTPPELFASAALAALGGAFFEAPKSAAGAALTRPDERPAFYRNLSVLSNLGMAVGPALGGLLIRFDFALVSLGAAAIFFVAAALALVFLPPVTVSSRRQSHLGEGLMLALRDRRFVIFTGLVMGFWSLSVQYNITLPLVAAEIGGGEGSVTLVLLTYSVVTILVQYPLLRLMEGRLPTMRILVVGMAVMAVGLGAIAFSGVMSTLMVCTAIFAVGNLMAMPAMNTVTARLVDPVAMGSYFAIGAYALGIGGAIGNLSGGALFDLGQDTGVEALPWVAFAVVGLAASVGLAWFGRRWDPGDRPAEDPVPAPVSPSVTSGGGVRAASR